MSVKVSCPACGGPVSFPVGSAIVAVCPYCRSVVARSDRGIEDLGKVAALVDTDSLLAVGVKGRFQNVPFELTGRTQLGHQAGGTWDEWYAAFADGRWGWLAEAQGRFYLTFEQPSPEGLPPFPAIRLGEGLKVSPRLRALLVAEKGEARAVSAEGAIPFRLVPGSTYAYADLSGPHREFATLDFSETPALLFTGQEVTLDDLGIPARARAREPEGRQVAGVQLACPQCGGPLELRAPDKTERVTCPNCGALLDVNQGQLRFLKALQPGKVRPIIPLGATGKLGDTPYIVIGYLKRSIPGDYGERYPWEEYLLYHPREGFRWLVRSDDHWNFVTPLSPGQVHAYSRVATWDGKDFKIFQKAMARVDHVLGEFYWKVAVGEEVEDSDYVRPPKMLSRETLRTGDLAGLGEVNWSHGTYLRPAEVEQAFGVKNLPRPAFGNVAPNQPFPYKRIYAYWGLLSGAAFFLGLMFLAIGQGRTVLHTAYPLPSEIGPEQPVVFFSDPFPLSANKNLKIDFSAGVNNSYLEIEGDLIEEGTDMTQPFSTYVSYYQGVEDGESWSEGSRETAVYLPPQPPGNYRLRLDVYGEPGKTPPELQVTVLEGAHRLRNLLFALLALSVIPLGVVVYHVYFEHQRWRDSEYSPFHSK
jgi:hypothetical protein